MQSTNYCLSTWNKFNMEDLTPPIITPVIKITANNTMYGVQETQSLNESFEAIVLKVAL